MKKILFVQGLWQNGGIEKVVNTYCKYFITKNYEVDIFTFEKNKSVFTSELEAMGINIICPKEDISGGYIKHNIKRVNAFLEAAVNYDIVHYNSSFAIAYIHCWMLKKRVNDTKVIIHSHGDSVNSPHILPKKIFNKLIKELLRNIPDYNLACSDKAGKWLFSKKVFSGRKYCTLMNPIDFNSYRYNDDKHLYYRQNYAIRDKEIVIGTIGRFSYQKNPEFIIEIIEGLAKRKRDFKFIWIGEGEEKEKIYDLVKKKHLESFIIFIDSINDISGILSAFDILILPSRYEGLPLVLVEAQASDLIIFASDTIDKKVKLTNKLSFLSIQNPELWVQEIISSQNKIGSRTYPYDEVENSEFNMERAIKKLSRIYNDILI